MPFRYTCSDVEIPVEIPVQILNDSETVAPWDAPEGSFMVAGRLVCSTLSCSWYPVSVSRAVKPRSIGTCTT